MLAAFTRRISATTILTALAVGAVYTISFFLPAYQGYDGAGAFGMAIQRSVGLWGREGHHITEDIFKWSPNAMLWIGMPLLAFGFPRLAAALAIPAILGSLMWLEECRTEELKAGYYLWTASSFLLLLFALVQWANKSEEVGSLSAPLAEYPRWLTKGEEYARLCPTCGAVMEVQESDPQKIACHHCDGRFEPQ